MVTLALTLLVWESQPSTLGSNPNRSDTLFSINTSRYKAVQHYAKLLTITPTEYSTMVGSLQTLSVKSHASIKNPKNETLRDWPFFLILDLRFLEVYDARMGYIERCASGIVFCDFTYARL